MERFNLDYMVWEMNGIKFKPGDVTEAPIIVFSKTKEGMASELSFDIHQIVKEKADKNGYPVDDLAKDLIDLGWTKKTKEKGE